MLPLARSLRAATGPRMTTLGTAVVAGVVVGVLAVIQAALLSRALDEAFLGGADLARLSPGLACLVAAGFARAFFQWCQEALAQSFSAQVRRTLRDRLVRRVLALGPRFTWGERSGELVNTLLGGVDDLDPYLARYLPQAGLAVLVPVTVLVAVLWADPPSALVLLLIFPLVPLFVWLVAGAAQEQARRQWLALSRLSARFRDALSGLATLRAFGCAEDEARAIERSGERYRHLTMQVLRLAFLSALVIEALATLGTAVVAVEVGLRLLYGHIRLAPALFVLLLAPEFYRPLRAFGAAFHARLPGREAASRVAELLETPGPFAAPAILAGDAERETGSEARSPRREPPAIRFESVRFAYRSGRAPALDDFSLELAAGATVSLVGPTGAGKTTAALLLLRFLEPDSGRIVVDGVPLAERPPAEWRRLVTWVPQRPRLFHGSLRENLLLARGDAPAEALDRAIAAAHLEELVRSLPHGLDTPLGEGGERLSGGEAQRLALARAFLKDAPVLVLDEPTAQLDPETESLVLEAIARLRRGRTCLLIAHRLTTVAAADSVALMSAGRVVEQGSPGALANAGGPYAGLLAAWEGA